MLICNLSWRSGHSQSALSSFFMCASFPGQCCCTGSPLTGLMIKVSILLWFWPQGSPQSLLSSGYAAELEVCHGTLRNCPNFWVVPWKIRTFSHIHFLPWVNINLSFIHIVENKTWLSCEVTGVLEVSWSMLVIVCSAYAVAAGSYTNRWAVKMYFT